MTDNPTCRICFNEETTDNKFVSPCKCTGSMKYIHNKCLLESLKFSINCTVCKSNYKVKKIQNKTYSFVSKYKYILSDSISIAVWGVIIIISFKIFNRRYDKILSVFLSFKIGPLVIKHCIDLIKFVYQFYKPCNYFPIMSNSEFTSLIFYYSTYCFIPLIDKILKKYKPPLEFKNYDDNLDDDQYEDYLNCSCTNGGLILYDDLNFETSTIFYPNNASIYIQN